MMKTYEKGEFEEFETPNIQGLKKLILK